MLNNEKYQFDYKDVQNIDFKLVLKYLGVPIQKETAKEYLVDLKGNEIKIIKDMNRYFVGKQVQNNINYVEKYRGCTRYEAGLELYNNFKSLVDSYKQNRIINEINSDTKKRMPEELIVDLDDLTFSEDKKTEKNITQTIQLKQNQIVKIQMLNSEMKVTNTIQMQNL